MVGTTSSVCRRAWNFADFAIDDRLRLFRFLLAIGDVRTDRLLQIVDVIDENAVDLVHRRIDVARNGDIDKEHGLVLAQRHELFAVFGRKMKLGEPVR
jgi:hypothetical protein